MATTHPVPVGAGVAPSVDLSEKVLLYKQKHNWTMAPLGSAMAFAPLQKLQAARITKLYLMLQYMRSIDMHVITCLRFARSCDWNLHVVSS